MNVRNYIHLTGNLGDAPKSVVLDSGTTATEFSLATNEYYRDRDGNRQTRTEWHRIKAYGKLAEIFDEYLVKGSAVSIVGSMRYRRWTDQHDQTRISAEVIASEFTFLGDGKNRPTATTKPSDAELMLVTDAEPQLLRKKTVKAA